MNVVSKVVKCLLSATLLIAGSPVLTSAQHYVQTNLVSDLSSKATNQDVNLVNAWGLTRSTNGPWWISNNGTGTSTLYNGTGTLFPPGNPLVVTIPPPKNAPAGTIATPTGTVFNGSQEFAVAPTKPAIFLFVTEDGTISGWNPGVEPTKAILVADHSGKAIYKGATLADIHGKRFLYVANFKTGRVEVYDGAFQRVHAIEREFAEFDGDGDDDRDDRRGRSDFAPFNVQNIGGNIFVTYAKKGRNGVSEEHGPGLGFVRIFSPTGRLLGHLQHGDWFDAPWGIAQAPTDFGAFSHAILVGNFGNGTVAAFNPVTFRFVGLMKNPDDSTLVIDRLWGLSFGSGGTSGPANSLFFTAGPNDEQDGLFGTLTAIPAEQVGNQK